MDNPFWDYSLRTYACDAVAPACISLQDEHGLDVNLLLYGAWLAHTGRRLTIEHLIAAEEVVADWRTNVIAPLRTLRRRMGAHPSAASVAVDLQTLELRAERHQQDMLYTLSQQGPALPPAVRPLSDNLALVARFNCSNNDGWTAAIGQLVAQIPL
ncbi:MAG: TIGR02444 family protein [Halioglobus sp.]